jgi:hypothetical protein
MSIFISGWWIPPAIGIAIVLCLAFLLGALLF